VTLGGFEFDGGAAGPDAGHCESEQLPDRTGKLFPYGILRSFRVHG
jgi:hypothetical protein